MPLWATAADAPRQWPAPRVQVRCEEGKSKDDRYVR